LQQSAKAIAIYNRFKYTCYCYL